MSVIIEPENWRDRFLACFGKQRAIYIPLDATPAAYLVARRESLLCALFRPRGQQPPSGWIYWDFSPLDERRMRNQIG